MKYFNNCHDLESLKKEYKRLSKKLHPDCGGTHEEFIAMQEEYKKRFDYFKRQQNKRAERDDSVKHTDEMPEEYMELIDKLIKFKGIDIEICGTWIWVSGDTKPVKDELKAIGFHFSGKRKMWHWHPVPKDSKKGWHRSSNKTMEEIRSTYGSYKVA